MKETMFHTMYGIMEYVLSLSGTNVTTECIFDTIHKVRISNKAPLLSVETLKAIILCVVKYNVTYNCEKFWNFTWQQQSAKKIHHSKKYFQK